MNGLIDDFVLFGKPSDYVDLAKTVESAVRMESIATLATTSGFRIDIVSDPEYDRLTTSLQNQENEYFSMAEWEQRDILRIWGSPTILEKLYLFLIDLSSRGHGYSYLAEYSEDHGYDNSSPVWRLHVLY